MRNVSYINNLDQEYTIIKYNYNMSFLSWHDWWTLIYNLHYLKVLKGSGQEQWPRVQHFSDISYWALDIENNFFGKMGA